MPFLWEKYEFESVGALPSLYGECLHVSVTLTEKPVDSSLKHMKPFLRWIVVGYILLVSIVFSARLLLPASSPLLWLINRTLFLFFIPLPFMVGIGMLALKKRHWPWLLLPILAFLLVYGANFSPVKNSDPSENGKTFRAMTFNILFRNDNHERTADLIKGSDADFVGLQEVLPETAEILAALLLDEYPYHSTFSTGRDANVALFSRYPIVDEVRLNLPPGDKSVNVLVDMDGVELRVIVIHLIPTQAEQVQPSDWVNRIKERQALRFDQTRRVLDSVDQSEEPVLVLCDCNFTEFSLAYAMFGNILNDSFKSSGWGFGHSLHPVGRDIRVFRVDYIWYSSGIASQSSQVIKANMSDHNAVVADLILVKGR